VSLHHSKYHSLGLSLRHVCQDGKDVCKNTSLELVQSITLVVSPELWPENVDSPSVSWSIRSLFGIGITSSCPLAFTSHIIVDNSNGELQLSQSVPHEKAVKGSKTYTVFDVERILVGGSTNIIANYKKSTAKVPRSVPLLHATRFVTGYGQENGEIVTRIRNEHSQRATVIFYDVIPWYLRIFFHKLKITQGGKVVSPKFSKLIPGVDRKRPYSIELVLSLPPKSETVISVAFEKSILKWLEYPPDANHGFYVGPAVITAMLPNRDNFTSIPRNALSLLSSILQDLDSTEEDGNCIRLYTEVLLVNLPTPDFSMPYNVICLACTVVALAFGPLHNITTRELVVESGTKKDSIVTKILNKLKFWKKKERLESTSQSESDDTAEQSDTSKKKE
jgi:GPI-anchor transamidase subunit T